LFADFDRALAAIPHERLAVQWDVCTEVVVLESEHDSSVTLQGISRALARCVGRVPGEVPVGLHLCYGDYGHRHSVQPGSIALQVRLLNSVLQAASRPINWASFTVPQDRGDEAYFAALRELAVGQETELYFGIVPYFPADQAAGATDAQVRAIDALLPAPASGRRANGGSPPSAGLAVSRPTTCSGSWTCTARSSRHNASTHNSRGSAAGRVDHGRVRRRAVAGAPECSPMTSTTCSM
jgi:hypothetical protein